MVSCGICMGNSHFHRHPLTVFDRWNTQEWIEKIWGLPSEQAAMLNVGFRKLVHLAAFGLLSVLIYNSFEKKRFLLAWLITTFYAATDEIHQAFVP